MKKIKFGICCPVFNEEDNILTFFEEYTKIAKSIKKKYIIEFLFTDNRSTDNSFEILKNLVKKNKNVTVIRFSKNFGVMKSIYTGILNSPSNWNAVAVFDCDMQDPPKLFFDFIKKWEEGYKIIYGSRIQREEPMIITLLRKIYKKIEKITTSEIQKIESGAWFLDKKIIDEIKSRDKFEPFLPGLINSLGFKTTSIDYKRKKRSKGSSKFNIFSYLSYAADGIVRGNSLPLRMSIYFGIFFGFFAFALSIFFVMAKFYFKVEYSEGIAAMIVLTLFNFGINFIFLGIIGEYLGRLYKKSEMERPAIIDEIIKR